MSWRPEDLAGTTVGGRYKVGRLLGKGGMGAVFEAVQVGLGRRVALKVLHPLLGEDEVHLRRLEREAIAAASLGHRNVVQVTDLKVGTSGFAYLVMELLEGRSLQEVLEEEGPLAVDRAIALVGQVADALSAAHAVGIVHRDIKPGNVMVVPMGDLGELVKVLDFGVAQLRDGPGYTRLTRAGAAVGTPSYMSPEQARGEAVDARSDVHALGALLFTVLTGRPPYLGEDVAEVLVRIVDSPPPSVATLRPGIPRVLDELVTRSLAKDRQARPASASAFAEQLRRCRGAASSPPADRTAAAPSRAVPPTMVPTSRAAHPGTGAAATVSSLPPAPSAAAAPAARRRWVLPLVLGLAVGLPAFGGLAALAFFFFRPAPAAVGVPEAVAQVAPLPQPPGVAATPPPVAEVVTPPPGTAPPSPMQGLGLVGGLERGFIYCPQPQRIDLQDRRIDVQNAGGLMISGPCELHCTRCVVVGPANGLVAANGAHVVLEASRIEGDNGLMSTEGSTIRAEACVVRGRRIGAVAAAGSTVTLVGGSVEGGTFGIFAVGGGRIETSGTTISGPVQRIDGGVVVQQ